MAEVLKRQFDSVFSTPIISCDVESLMEDYGPRGLKDIEFTAAITLKRKSSKYQPTQQPDQTIYRHFCSRNAWQY